MHIPERYTKQPKKIRRFTIRWILFLLVYGAVLRKLLIQQNILSSVIFLLASLFILLFLVLDFDLFTKKQISIGVGILLLISFLVFISSAQLNLNTILAFIFLNFGFIALIWTKDMLVFYPWEYFTGGGYLFGLLISLAYSFFIVGTSAQYQVNCEKMYGWLDTIAKEIQGEYLGEGSVTQSEAKSLLVDTMDSSALPQNDEISHPEWNEGSSMQKIDASSKTQTRLTSQNDKKNKNNYSFIWWFLTAWKEVLADFWLSKKNIKNTRDQFLKEINDLGDGVIDKGKNLWNEININRKALSLSACKYLSKQIGFLYQNTYFQIALVILMSLVFVWLIRLITWIVTIVAYIVFKILQWIGIYRVKKAAKMVDTVE